MKPRNTLLESGYEALGSYRFPDPHAPDRFARIDRELERRGERYVLGWVWFTLFERLWMLRGFDNRVRQGGAHVWMHLCGNIMPILPDLIEIGLHVLNPIQPQAMNVEILSREFGGQVCFYGGVDVQGTMVRGTAERARSAVRVACKGPAG
jgi:hypothetical protein